MSDIELLRKIVRQLVNGRARVRIVRDAKRLGYSVTLEGPPDPACRAVSFYVSENTILRESSEYLVAVVERALRTLAEAYDDV